MTVTECVCVLTTSLENIRAAVSGLEAAERVTLAAPRDVPHPACSALSLTRLWKGTSMNSLNCVKKKNLIQSMICPNNDWDFRKCICFVVAWVLSSTILIRNFKFGMRRNSRILQFYNYN